MIVFNEAYDNIRKFPRKFSAKSTPFDREGTPLWRGGEAVTKDGRVAFNCEFHPFIIMSSPTNRGKRL